MKLILILLLTSALMAGAGYVGMSFTMGWWPLRLMMYIGLAGVLINLIAYFVYAKRKGRVSIFDNGERELGDDEV